MTQYLLSVHHTVGEAMPEGDEMQRMFDEVGRFNEKVREAGAWVFAGGLHGIDVATTVDATGSEVMVVDGPYAESKEYLGGFWIIEAADLDEALQWATQGSAACGGRVEVRPFQEG